MTPVSQRHRHRIASVNRWHFDGDATEAFDLPTLPCRAAGIATGICHPTAQKTRREPSSAAPVELREDRCAAAPSVESASRASSAAPVEIEDRCGGALPVEGAGSAGRRPNPGANPAGRRTRAPAGRRAPHQSSSRTAARARRLSRAPASAPPRAREARPSSTPRRHVHDRRPYPSTVRLGHPSHPSAGAPATCDALSRSVPPRCPSAPLPRPVCHGFQAGRNTCDGLCLPVPPCSTSRNGYPEFPGPFPAIPGRCTSTDPHLRDRTGWSVATVT
jgi:hypothetical protein